MQKLILASASPRRRELLAQITKFQVEPSLFEECAGGLSAQDTVLAFARGKAQEVFSRFPDSLVLGADTVVAIGGTILGKPRSQEEAIHMLSCLSGREHSVFTGVCLVGRGVFLDRLVETKVKFNVLSKEFILKYVESGSPMDKAGGYGIQDGGLVASYEGSYTNVVGLPMETVRAMLEEGNYVETYD